MSSQGQKFVQFYPELPRTWLSRGGCEQSHKGQPPNTRLGPNCCSDCQAPHRPTRSVARWTTELVRRV
eukprot:747976-Heterocapsa_arctica.AAC.1